MLDIFRRKSPATSAELDAALTGIDLDKLRSSLADAEAARAALLLTGSDKDILEAEAKITSARLAFDRAIAARAELERRLADAKVAEATAVLDAERASVESECAALKRDFASTWRKHAAPLVGLLERFDALERRLEALNTMLSQAGREDLVHSVEVEFFAQDYVAVVTTTPRFQTDIPAHFGAPGWLHGVLVAPSE